MKKRIKLIIDTNIWVSLAIGSETISNQMHSILSNNNLELIASFELIDELTETLKKKKLQKYLNKE